VAAVVGDYGCGGVGWTGLSIDLDDLKIVGLDETRGDSCCYFVVAAGLNDGVAADCYGLSVVGFAVDCYSYYKVVAGYGYDGGCYGAVDGVAAAG
jgi:hypothetical protein